MDPREARRMKGIDEYLHCFKLKKEPEHRQKLDLTEKLIATGVILSSIATFAPYFAPCIPPVYNIIKNLF